MSVGRERRKQERSGEPSGFALLSEAEQDAAVVELLRGGEKTFTEMWRALPGASDERGRDLHLALIRLERSARIVADFRRHPVVWRLP